jgi:hypothetical protein
VRGREQSADPEVQREDRPHPLGLLGVDDQPFRDEVVPERQSRLYHLRTEQGRQEIDVLAEIGAGQIVAFEVKATSSPDTSTARHLSWLRDALGERFLAGVVLHTGPRSFELGERITAAPISCLWT